MNNQEELSLLLAEIESLSDDYDTRQQVPILRRLIEAEASRRERAAEERVLDELEKKARPITHVSGEVFDAVLVTEIKYKRQALKEDNEQ